MSWICDALLVLTRLIRPPILMFRSAGFRAVALCPDNWPLLGVGEDGGFAAASRRAHSPEEEPFARRELSRVLLKGFS